MITNLVAQPTAPPPIKIWIVLHQEWWEKTKLIPRSFFSQQEMEEYVSRVCRDKELVYYYTIEVPYPESFNDDLLKQHLFSKRYAN